MIGHIEGAVFAVRGGYVVISAGGVGYKVALTREALAAMKNGQTATLWTHLAVRENALDLYGFRTEEELHVFEMLLSVSGIGPKSALAILDMATVSTLRSAISQGNAGYLTNVSGIGKKTAQKIILELKDKIGLSAEGVAAALSSDEEALSAMRTLGYSQNEARDALRKVPQNIKSTSERLREALRLLGKQ